MTATETRTAGNDLKNLLARIERLQADRPPSEGEASGAAETHRRQGEAIAKDIALASGKHNVKMEADARRRQAIHEAKTLPTFNVAARRDYLLAAQAIGAEAQAALEASAGEFGQLCEARRTTGMSLDEGKRLRELERIRATCELACHEAAAARQELERLLPGRVGATVNDIRATLKTLNGVGVCGPAVDRLRARFLDKLHELEAARQTMTWSELQSIDVSL